MFNKNRYKGASARIGKRRRVQKSASLILKSVVLLLLLVGAGFLLRADFLKVREFKIVGAVSTPLADLENTANTFASGYHFGLLPKSNILILDDDRLAEKILAQFTRLDNVEVDKKFFSQTVEIKVMERGAEYLWCNESEICFFMSSDGLIFEKVSAEKSLEVVDKIIFKGQLSGEPLLEHFATAERMRGYAEFFSILDKNQITISSVNFELPDKAVVSTNMGNIVFNPEEKDLSEVALNIVLLIEELKLKNPATRFEYIDARFGNKVFYKQI